MKHFTTTILLAITIQSFGQFIKGDKALGGGLILSVNNSPINPGGTSLESRSFDLAPTFGVFVSSNLEVGGQVSLSTSYNVFTSATLTTERTRNDLGIGLYLQRYFPLADRFLLTMAAGIDYGFGKELYKATDMTPNGTIEEENDVHSVDFRVGPRFIFLPTTHWALQFGFGGIGYTFVKNKEDGRYNNFKLYYGGVGLGLVYYFRSSQ